MNGWDTVMFAIFGLGVLWTLREIVDKLKEISQLLEERLRSDEIEAVIQLLGERLPPREELDAGALS